MPKNEEKMHFPKVTVDEFFTTQEERNSAKLEKIQNVNTKMIDNFKEHPFKVIDDEKMFETVESIKEHGVLVPAIIRPKENGKYEMVAGHRRKRACELAQIDELPCIIRNLTDDEATIIMVDSNLQREQILPSERAFAYKMKLEAQKHQGIKISCGQDVHKSRDSISEEMSGRQVQRYVRLTYLIPEILELVDNQYLNKNDKNKMAILPAVEISYLKDDEQYALLDTIERLQVTPSHAQAIVMRKRSNEGTLTVDKIEEMLGEEKANQIPTIKLKEDRFIKILPPNLKSSKEREDYIYHCVEIVRNKELKHQKDYSR